MSSVIRVLPADLTFHAEDGETIMSAAERAKLYWPTVCGGAGACRACFAVVVEGSAALSSVGPWEAEGLATLRAAPANGEAVRLACQAKVHGALTVYKRGVRARQHPGEDS